jgi:hypothetical protein
VRSGAGYERTQELTSFDLSKKHWFQLVRTVAENNYAGATLPPPREAFIFR